jgi:hypothetical protein
MHTYIYIYDHSTCIMYVCMYTFTYIHIYVHKYIYIHIHTYTHTHIHTYTHTHAHARTHTNKHKQTHTHTHTHTHTQITPEVRAAAAECLREIAGPGDKRVITALVSHLHDEGQDLYGHYIVRAAVLRAISSVALCDANSVVAVSPRTREMATAGALGRLEEEDWYVRKAAAQALASVCTGAVLNLEDISSHGNSTIATDHFGAPNSSSTRKKDGGVDTSISAVLQKLIMMLEDPNAHVRGEVSNTITALAARGDNWLTAILAVKLIIPQQDVRSAIAALLQAHISKGILGEDLVTPVSVSRSNSIMSGPFTRKSVSADGALFSRRASRSNSIMSITSINVDENAATDGGGRRSSMISNTGISSTTSTMGTRTSSSSHTAAVSHTTTEGVSPDSIARASPDFQNPGDAHAARNGTNKSASFKHKPPVGGIRSVSSAQGRKRNNATMAHTGNNNENLAGAQGGGSFVNRTASSAQGGGKEGGKEGGKRNSIIQHNAVHESQAGGYGAAFVTRNATPSQGRRDSVAVPNNRILAESPTLTFAEQHMRMDMNENMSQKDPEGKRGHPDLEYLRVNVDENVSQRHVESVRRGRPDWAVHVMDFLRKVKQGMVCSSAEVMCMCVCVYVCVYVFTEREAGYGVLQC